MKRTTSLKRGRRRTLTAEEREQAELFHAAVSGRSCAACDRYVDDDKLVAHHVVEAQTLRARGLPVYDTRNVLPLCESHHMNHHSTKRVPFRKLRADNIAYAYEVLGDYAGDYLKRYPMDETEEQL